MLTILQVAYPLAPVSLNASGGAEHIMALLDRGLAARCHRSIAVACAGSSTAGILLPVKIAKSFDERSREQAREAFRERICQALEDWNVDLVHMHGVDFYEYLPPAGVPTLVTLHLPISYYPASVFCLDRPATYLNCVSEVQRRTCPASGSMVDTIENGIPLELFPERLEFKENYVLAMGRICPEKGFHLAIDSATRAGVALHLAGSVFPYAAHEAYFQEQILPRLNPPHRFLGALDFSTKIETLSRARCLLAPSLVAETSSLVTMEALACGTPVVGFPAGALSEMIENGKTGFLVRDVEEMAAAIRRAESIDPNDCRRAASVQFRAERMIDRYLALYERLASEG